MLILKLKDKKPRQFSLSSKESELNCCITAWSLQRSGGEGKALKINPEGFVKPLIITISELESLTYKPIGQVCEPASTV